jgi:hypothetical protein
MTATPFRPIEDFGYDKRTEALLRIFIQDGRLRRLPARRGRRRVVLEHVAVYSFEPGVRYAEREVDTVLRTWCEGGEADHVTLRRYLVDEGLLSRAHGVYWRTAGWVDTAESSAQRSAESSAE